MNRHAINISAVFLKDVRQFWPMAALAVVTILLPAFIDMEHAPALARQLLLPLAGPLIAAILLVGLVHQDAPASLRHEWLTRPAGTLDLLVAKFLLLVAAVLLPVVIGPVVSVAGDGPAMWAAFLLSVANLQLYLIAGFVVLIAAAVTATLLQTAGILFGLGVFFTILYSRPQLQPPSVGGSEWVVDGVAFSVIFVGGIVALWLQYADRRTIVARGAAGATFCLAIAATAMLSRDAVLSVQKAVTGQHPAADSFDVTMEPGCFEARYFDPPAAGSVADVQRGLPRFRAVIFSTAAHARKLPEGWQMRIGQMRASFVDSRGVVLAGLKESEPHFARRVAPDGEFEARDEWWMRRERFDAISGQATGLRLDYETSLLQPVHTAEIPADGERHSLPGLGMCVAKASSATAVQVSCFKAGHQPDMLTARIAGEYIQEVTSRYRSFAPDWLQSSPGKNHVMNLRIAAPTERSRVTITAYEARAIVTRSVSVPGMLGGPSCVPSGQP